MVLESLLNPFVVKRKPWEMLIAGFLYTIIGLIISYIVFKDAVGLLSVFLIVFASLPVIYTTIKNEEELDLQYDNEWKLLKEHSKVLTFLIFFFIGVTLAFALVYIFLPSEMTNVMFDLQRKAIVGVNNQIQGNATEFNIFTRIFANNLKVLFFCIFFSFLYGSGAIFILTWNASVVAVAIGHLFKTEIAKSASLVGFQSIAAYFSAASFSFWRYMSHGLIEMASYFVAGLAGSIISIALIKHNLNNDNVLTDALDLILISIGILLVAAIVEVYITPTIFGHSL